MKTLLLLEDNSERITTIEAPALELGEDWQVRVWRDAPTIVPTDAFSVCAFLRFMPLLYNAG